MPYEPLGTQGNMGNTNNEHRRLELIGSTKVYGNNKNCFIYFWGGIVAHYYTVKDNFKGIFFFKGKMNSWRSKN